MKKNKNIKKYSHFFDIILFVGIVLIISVVVDVSVVMKTVDSKQQTAEAEETTSTEDTFDCKTAVVAQFSASGTAFNDFLTTTLSSTGTTSDLIANYLIPQYIELLESSQSALEEATLVSGSYGYVDTSEKIAECQAIINENLDATTQVMKAEVSSSASAKKTSALLDEYKFINDHLRDMNMSVAYIQAYLSKMFTAMPAFTKTCVTK